MSIASWRDNVGEGYVLMAFLVGGIVGLGIWAYAIFSLGLIMGVMIGWIPALIGGSVAGFLWPLTVLGILGFWFLIFG